MARVFIPNQLREVTGGQAEVEVVGENVRRIIAAVDAIYPGFAARVTDQGEIVPGLAVCVDNVTTSRNLLTKVGADSEVYFVLAIAGG